MNTANRTTLLENSSLAMAAIVFGIMAGFFWTYSFNVNYAFLQLDGPSYAQAQSLVNQNVRHAMFFFFFIGGGVFSVLALVVNIRQRRTVSFWLLALAAAVYILGVILYTRQVNLPLNYYTESWDLENLPADWTATRDSWNSANLIRVGTSFASFLLCIIAFVLRSSKG